MDKPSLRYTIVIYLLILVSGAIPRLWAQPDTVILSLSDLIQVAESEAPAAVLVRQQFRRQYWRHQAFIAQYRPQLKLRATLPDLNRSIDPITLSDGSEAFVDRSLMRNQLGLELQQYLPLTGGQLFANTSLQRIDFSNSSTGNSRSYLSVPISIGLRQPLFGFNALRWDRSIETLRFKENKRQSYEQHAAIGSEVIAHFFGVLRAQTNWVAAQRHQAEAETMYTLAQARFAVGKIAETELLQLELNVRNATANSTESRFAWENAMDQLQIFAGFAENVVVQLRTPDDIPRIELNTAFVLDKALRQRSELITFQRQEQEAQRDLVRAEKESGLQVDLFLSFGLSQTAPVLRQAYADPLNQERLQIGIQMPLVDWGAGEAQVKIARTNLTITQLQTSQARTRFERSILTRVAQFNQIQTQVELAKEAQRVAEKRLDITRNRYRIGKIGITELSLALNEEANARRRFLGALQNYWLALYDLRQLTLFDFVTGKPIAADLSPTLPTDGTP